MVDYTVAGTPRVRRAGLHPHPADLLTADAGRTSALTYSVIIAATNRPATLDACLEAVREAADPPDEVIVIDRPPGVGPAAARNAGAMQASGSVLIFVDSDVLVHPDVFTRIRATFAAHPELSAVFGSYDDIPSVHGVVSTFRNALHHYVHQGSPGTATTFWAGLGAVRREAFIAVDGFDDWRFQVPSVEDIELGLRLGIAGGHIRLDPTILGTHLKHWRVGTMMRTDLLSRGTPWTAIMLAHGARAARLNVRGTHLLAVATFSAGLAATGLGRPRLAAPLMA
ncbi:MAG TPA: glycosyltransferase family A protein, partial [Thermoleophilaceae bacterium]|nr:glycosyltransferase family A protein [Thermoleophilaceae bacterium]